MTTIVNFTPSTAAAPKFSATLDGALYTVTVPWNLFGQDHYINVQAQDGTTILYRPLTPSPDGYSFNLLEGYFVTSTMVFLDSSQQFVITP